MGEKKKGAVSPQRGRQIPVGRRTVLASLGEDTGTPQFGERRKGKDVLFQIGV